MRQAGPSITKVESWASWEAFCLKCLRHALDTLLELKELPEGENALNAKLHSSLRVAAKKFRPKGPYDRISYECPPQPYGVHDDESSRRLKATPDFAWGFVDHRDPDPHRNARELAIECKRVREASPSWKYNESYVEDGVQRFLDEKKKYGIGVSSGVMVGYWQRMDSKDVLDEVNTAAKTHGIPALRLSREGWRVSSISQLDHSFTRPFPDTRFQLRHLWIDLRTKYKQDVPKARGTKATRKLAAG
jgi:hypothetical protein